MEIRVKLPLGETSPVDKQKCCNANMTGLLHPVRVTPVDIYHARGTKEISRMNILQ